MSITTTQHSRLRLTGYALLAAALSACSVNHMVVRGSMGLIRGSVQAMNRETDLKLAGAAIPANLKMMEGMAIEDPGNVRLQVYLAQAFYGYAYGFVELQNPRRASALYWRGYAHARAGLQQDGLHGNLIDMPVSKLKHDVAHLDRNAVPALFWTASCLAKWADMNRNKPRSIAQLPRAAVLMQRVLDLDGNYYYGGAHLFFGVYYGSRPPMFGGNYKRAANEFAKARAATHGKLLMVDVLEAQFLDRQRLDQRDFHRRLTAVLNAPDDLFPAMALSNRLAKERAHYLLKKEHQWF